MVVLLLLFIHHFAFFGGLEKIGPVLGVIFENSKDEIEYLHCRRHDDDDDDDDDSRSFAQYRKNPNIRFIVLISQWE
jgi:hypothetical protein